MTSIGTDGRVPVSVTSRRARDQSSRPASSPSRRTAQSSFARATRWCSPRRRGRAEAREGADFFPLTVDVEERMYAAGKIPGGFFKREGRPTERAILTARMIDRPIRPLWPKGFRNEVQCIATVLSADLVTAHDILCINGVSAALMISPLPFLGPGRRRTHRPDRRRARRQPLDAGDGRSPSSTCIVVGTKDGLTMVEAGADEVPEETLLEAFELAHERDRAALRGAGGAAEPQSARRSGSTTTSRPSSRRHTAIAIRARIAERACARLPARSSTRSPPSWPGRCRWTSTEDDIVRQLADPRPACTRILEKQRARGSRGPGARAVRRPSCVPSPTPSRTRRSSSPRSGSCSSTASSTSVELPFPIGAPTRARRQGRGDEDVHQEGGRRRSTRTSSGRRSPSTSAVPTVAAPRRSARSPARSAVIAAHARLRRSSRAARRRCMSTVDARHRQGGSAHRRPLARG